MMFRGLFANRSPYRKLLVLVGFALFSVVIFTMIGSLCSALLYGVNPLTNPNIMNDTANVRVVSSLKLLQTFSALGLFVVPVLAAAFLFDTQPLAWLKLDKQPAAIIFLLVIVTIVISGPVINWINELNQHLTLPAALKGLEDWMKQAEDQAAELTKVFLGTSTYKGLAVNLFVIALLPAIGEELLFRGAVQRLLCELTRNKHAGILLSAIAFSALHMQFYGFLPRMMLGIYFGYIVMWTGSLWPAIIGHFINNASAVVLYFVQQKEKLPIDPDKIGTKTGDEIILLASLLLTSVCVGLVYRAAAKKTGLLDVNSESSATDL